MTDAKRDNNYVTTLIAVSSVDGVTPVTLYADPTTHRLLTAAANGTLASLTDVTLTSVAQGDVLYYNGTKWVNLPAGTNGFVLTTGGPGANPSWTSAGSGTVTTVSIVTANGVSGSVATATTTPAITLILGAITPTSVNGLTITANGTNTLNIAAGKTLTISNSLTFAGTDGQTFTFPNGSDTVVTLGASQTLTNKTLTTPVLNGAPTGTGVATAATASTLALRDANGNLTMVNALEGFTSTATAAGTTTLTVSSNYMQVFTGSTTQTVTLPVATTLVNGQSWLIVNNSTGAVTVQTSGSNSLIVLAGGTSATVTCVNTAGGTGTASWSAIYYGVAVTSAKKLSVSNSLTLAGVDGKTLTVNNNLTLAGTDGKTLTVSNSLTLAGTDSTTMTFPSTSATIARTDAAQTFTGTQTFSQIVTTNNAITASGNAATVPITSRLSTVTNNSAATLTITMTTASAVDGQMIIVRILDFSAVAQTITWVNTENSTISAPTTTNGSTTLPLTVGFMYNSATSKWRCIASA